MSKQEVESLWGKPDEISIVEDKEKIKAAALQFCKNFGDTKDKEIILAKNNLDGWAQARTQAQAWEQARAWEQAQAWE